MRGEYRCSAMTGVLALTVAGCAPSNSGESVLSAPAVEQAAAGSGSGPVQTAVASTPAAPSRADKVASAPPAVAQTAQAAMMANTPPALAAGALPTAATTAGAAGRPAKAPPSSANAMGVMGVMEGKAGSAATSGKPGPSGLPSVKGSCPEFANGMLTVAGTSLQLWAGTKPGPVYFYWHATTQHYDEVERALPNATKDVATKGGFVASFENTNMQGTNTGNNVWYTGDFDATDQLLACGIEKGLVDTTRIFTAGYSAGGIQACAMVTTHASYLAAAICYSGSAAVIGGAPKDPSRLPPTLVPHGAPGSDVLILDMAQQSVAWEDAYTKAGGFAIDCMDGGDHLSSAFTRMGLDGHAMEFLEAHPFGVMPEPYAAGLPAGWPQYCKIVKP